MIQSTDTHGVVSQLVFYPVKSLQGVSVEEAVFTPRGIKQDRMWMLVRENGKFITQREEHRLALLQLETVKGGFRITAPSGDRILLPTYVSSDSMMSVRVWKDALQAVPGPFEANEFFSDYLGYACVAVFMPDQADRTAREFAPPGTPLSFADAYPGLLITSASLVDLNERTSIPIEMARLRPNIVVSGTTSYADDGWAQIDIGEVSIDCVKPCARCVLTTVDPSTGTAGKEPLMTLARYRRIRNDVFFGQNFVVSKAGTVKLGDKVQVVQTKDLLFPGSG